MRPLRSYRRGNSCPRRLLSDGDRNRFGPLAAIVSVVLELEWRSNDMTTRFRSLSHFFFSRAPVGSRVEIVPPLIGLRACDDFFRLAAL